MNLLIEAIKMNFSRPHVTGPASQKLSAKSPSPMQAALRAIAPQCVLMSLAAGAAMLPPAALGQATAISDARIFTIPAGPLDAALARFARIAGVNLSYDAALISGLSSNGVSGNHGVTEALQQLLAGSGIEAVAQPAGGYLLRPETRVRPSQVTDPASRPRTGAEEPVTELDTAIVEGERLPEEYGGGQIARGSRLGLLGNRDVMDTPFSTASYTAQLMKDIQARSLAQAVVADPSVHFAGSSSRTYDGFEIRGFAFQSQSLMFDGLYGVAPPLQVAVEMVERVELIKGPTALLGGMSPTGAVGGSINLVPKRAGGAPSLQVTATYYSDAEIGAHVDLGRRLGADQEFGVRLNVVYRDGDLALEGNSREAVDAVLGLDFVREGFRLTGDLGYQERSIKGVDADHYLAGDVTVLPEAPDADSAHFQPWSFQNTDATYGVLRAEYEISPHAMTYAAAGFGHSKARLVAGFAFPLQQSGDFTENYWGDAQDYDSVSGEAGFRAALRTGPVEHQFALAAMRIEREDGVVNVFDNAIVGGLPPTPSNLYTPTFVPEPSSLGTFPRVPKTSETVLSSLALADTLSFAGGRTLVTLGARLQKVRVDGFNPTGNVTSSYDEDAISPALGVVFKAREHISLYGNYSQGLSRGPTAPSQAINAGEIFPPYKTEQAETGIKIDYGTFMSSVALFDIRQPSGIMNPSTLVFSLDGERRHRGIEANTFGSPVNGVRILGGIAYLDAELTKTQGGLNDGRTPPGVSEVSVSIGGEWDTPFLEGLTLSVRRIHGSAFYVDTANAVKAPRRTTVNLGARYAMTAAGRPLTLRLIVENLLDKAYWNSFDLVRGAPRTVLMSGTMAF